jgi:hypothetical protein
VHTTLAAPTTPAGTDRRSLVFVRQALAARAVTDRLLLGRVAELKEKCARRLWTPIRWPRFRRSGSLKEPIEVTEVVLIQDAVDPKEELAWGLAGGREPRDPDALQPAPEGTVGSGRESPDRVRAQMASCRL